MKKILNNPYLNLAARIAVAWFFIFAAIGKIADPLTFSKEMSNYGILPLFSINIISLFLPWLELFTAIMLLGGVRLKANSALISIMLIVFIAAVLIAMAKGLNINCGCVSHKITYVGWKKVGENSIMLLASLYVFFFPVQKFTLEHWYSKDINN